MKEHIDLSFIPENKIGDYAIEHFVLTEEDVRRVRMQDAIRGEREYSGIQAGVKYTRLMHGHEVVMSNTPMEMDTNYVIMRHAKGRVLVAGLGLGMVLIAISKLRDVTSIFVCEKNWEVYNLVYPHIAGKLMKVTKAMHYDIFEFRDKVFKRPFKPCYDSIYFDIWNDSSGDNWEEMKKLKRMYRPLLTDGGLMRCWREDRSRYMCARDREQTRIMRMIANARFQERKVANV
jgi:hypothetical protein